MRLTLISLIAAATVLVGCTSGASSQKRNPDPVPALNYEKMAQVERAAQGRGVRVIWINPPEAREAKR